jgi:hypothetical protein
MRNFFVSKFRLTAIPLAIWLCGVALTTIAGCTSRYRLDLYITEQASRRKVDVQETQYLRGSVLADPTAQNKILPGPGNAIVITFSTRGQRESRPEYSVLTYDEQLTYRVYLQLLERPQPSTVPLRGNSFAQLLGSYEQQPEEKIYLPDSGTFVIDSVTTKRLFGAIHGDFVNSRGTPITLDGKFSVKIAK